MNTEPVSILYTIPNFITAGSGRAMLNIIERLDKTKYAPAVCVSQKGGKLDRAVEKMGIPFIEQPFTVPAKPYISLWQRATEAARPFKPYRFRLWHSFHYLDDYSEAIIARRAGAKWVYTKKNMNWKRPSWHIRTVLAARVAAQNTDMMHQFFATPLYRGKTRLIPRGVVTQKFNPAQACSLALREKFKISSKTNLIGCVAHFLPVKGHNFLIEAVSKLPEATLLLAGKPLDQDYALSLRQQVDDLGLSDRVFFLDFVEDVPAFLAEIDIFVLPTVAHGRMEGCPVALLEAMASGKPCVATDIPGSRDIVENGSNGFLVPAHDGKSLNHAIAKLMQDEGLRKRLGENARSHIIKHYTIEQEVALHEAIYQELIVS